MGRRLLLQGMFRRGGGVFRSRSLPTILSRAGDGSLGDRRAHPRRGCSCGHSLPRCPLAPSSQGWKFLVEQPAILGRPGVVDSQPVDGLRGGVTTKGRCDASNPATRVAVVGLAELEVRRAYFLTGWQVAVRDQRRRRSRLAPRMHDCVDQP